MKIRSAVESDHSAIRRLWHDCFGDPYEYIDFYMQKRFDDQYCAVLELDGEVVGMIHLLPCTIYPKQKALYWYAAGIRSDKRKQGLFRTFAEYVKNQTNTLGFQNFCVPAPGLEKYYQSLGFTTPYTASDEIYTKTTQTCEKTVQFEKASAEDFINFTNAIAGDTFWDEKAIQYAIEENEYCGGKALRFTLEQNNFIFFAIKKDDGFMITYHNMTKEDFLKVKSAIFNELNCEQLVFRTGGNEKIVGLTDAKNCHSNSKITMTLA